MSSDFSTVNVVDSELLGNSSITYAVQRGAQHFTPSQFEANTKSVNAIQWNIQVPSENTIISRKVNFYCEKIVKVSMTTANNGLPFVRYGYDTALCAYPLHQMCQTMNATINNNTVSQNTADILPQLLHTVYGDSTNQLNSTSAYQPDLFTDYNTGLNTNLNVLAGFQNSSDLFKQSRGSVKLLGWGTTEAKAESNTPADWDQPANGNGAVHEFYFRFGCYEPLLLSPFVFNNSQLNKSGLWGVQNMNFNFILNSGSRVMRHAWAGNAFTSSISKIVSARLDFLFKSVHADMLLPSRCVVPYLEFPRFLTSSNNAIAAGAKASLVSSNIQLNTIPDKLIIVVKPVFALSAGNADWFLKINRISLNWNNAAGLLSSAQPSDLFRYSLEAGSKQTWELFNGAANMGNVNTGVNSNVATCGPVLILDLGKHVALDSFYAPGSIGNFSLQFQLDVENHSAYALTGSEINLITVNSGVFVSERGSSQTYTGILNKDKVLQAAEQEPYSSSDVDRVIGGSLWDSIKSGLSSVVSNLPKILPVAKTILKMSGNPAASSAADVISSAGYGKRQSLESRLM